MEPIKLHKKIREFIQAGVEVADFAYLKSNLFVNPDAVAYFYAHIDYTWIESLAKNDFFKVLDIKSPDSTTYSYRTPELSYLRNSVDADPEVVTEVMLATKISADNFNPEVVDQFIWIASKLPAGQLSKIVEKMQQEQWVKLMAGFRKTGYEFSEMVETLQKASDWDGLINLAKAILINRDEKGDKYRDGCFYVGDIAESGIFEALIGLEDQEKNQDLITYLLNQYKTIIEKFGKEYPTDKNPFKHHDPIALLDEDMFSIKIERNRMRSFDANEKSFVALIVELLKKISDEKLPEVFEKLQRLPSTRLTWKIRLVFLVEHKEHFVNEIHTSLNFLFELDNYYSVYSGTEYKKAVGRVFSMWSPEWQKEYIAKLVSFFKKQVADHLDQPWHKQNAVQMLSIISGSISDETIKKIIEKHATKDFGIPVNESYQPKPSMESGMAGTVLHQSPFTLSGYSLDEIFEHLKTDWDPAKLKEEYRNDDYLKPRGAEGLGDALKEHLKQNLDTYLSKMSDLNYEEIHPHYVYSFLHGLEDLFRNDIRNWTKLEIESVLKVLVNLQNQKSIMQEFKPVEDSWLGNWVWVKRSMADVLIYIIEYKNKELRKEIHTDFKIEILGLLSFLFETPESPNAEEEKPEYGDPFQIAINSVRGRVYQGFVVYVENDGDELSRESKEFFEKVLAEKPNSIAVRFVIGHYLPSIYYRAKDYISDKFSDIFPEDHSDKLATWEGYLCSPLYKELYEKLERYYERALDNSNYPDRKYTKDLDEGIASHIALAFVHFQKDHTGGLVGKFLEKKNSNQIGEFVTFIGRSYFTNDNTNKSKWEDLPGGLAKFLNFWDWMLGQNLKPEAYEGFGFWINSRIVDIKLLTEKMNHTLELSGGAISWDYKFEQALERFAEADPKIALNIVRNYLLNKDGGLNQNRRLPFFAIDDEIKKTLEIIYKQEILKPEVEKLINELIEKGSQTFWGLEDIIK